MRFAFAHHPHRVLAGVQPLAFVRDELFLDAGEWRILRSAYSLGICRELGIAIFTHVKHRNIIFCLTILYWIVASARSRIGFTVHLSERCVHFLTHTLLLPAD